MKIHFFVQHYPIPYKPYYDTQFADLIEAGHDVRIFAAGRDAASNEKVREYGLDRLTSYYPATLRTLAPRLPGLLSKLLRSPAVGRHVLGSVNGTATSAKERLVQTARALAVVGEAPDVCFVHGLGTAAQVSWLKRLYAGTPVAMYYHGGEVPSVRELEQRRVRAAFANADVVFTNTEFSRDHAISRGCPTERIEVLPVGFALQDYAPPTKREYRRGGMLRLMSAGRMSEEKGFIHALEAVRMLVRAGHTNIRYSLTGEGYVRPQLERFVTEHGLEPHVTFLGRLSAADVIAEMGRADALLLPSLQVGNWVENQACAVQEAMLMKAAVIISRTGGVPESIPPEMQRFIVPPADSEALASAIADLAAMSTGELSILGEAGRSFVETGYDIHELNRRMLARISVRSS